MKRITGKIRSAMEAILHFALATIFAGGVVRCAVTAGLTFWQRAYAAAFFDCGIIYLVVTGVILLRRKTDTT